MSDLTLKHRPSALSKDSFLAIYGGIYEHSPQFAERVWATTPHEMLDTVEGLLAALKAEVDRATPDAKLALIRAHPDLGGRPAFRGKLSTESMSEQSGAGLLQAEDAVLNELARLNATYKEKFGFPFIVAVRGLTREDILEQFRKRVGHDRDTEFATAMSEIHKIARLRLLNLAAQD
jgi:2-oxo-4-hydroxy-4-carboxy-5-ureidoimidazoline decarboxylase